MENDPLASFMRQNRCSVCHTIAFYLVDKIFAGDRWPQVRKNIRVRSVWAFTTPLQIGREYFCVLVK